MSDEESHAPLFFVEDLSGSSVSLGLIDSRHLSKVRRAKPGDLLQVADGRGMVSSVRITSVSDREVVADVISSEFAEAPLLEVCVYQALPKGNKADLIVQKLTEIGVGRLVMFRADRSIPTWDRKRSSAAFDRWSAIAMEAAKQSNRPRLPVIDGLWDAQRVAQDFSSSEVQVIAQISSQSRLRDVLPVQMPSSLALIIGPEGGLTDEESGLFAQAGAMPASFGSGILRTETAALVGATMVLFHYERLG